MSAKTSAGSKMFTIIGWILTLVPAALLLMSAVMKFTKPESVVEGFKHLGLSDKYALGLGIIELACTVLYLFSRTAVLGAILLTGYLGGATFAHLRVGDPFIMPALVGVVIWAGAFLREPRLRVIIPLRR